MERKVKSDKQKVFGIERKVKSDKQKVFGMECKVKSDKQKVISRQLIYIRDYRTEKMLKNNL